MLSRSAQRVQGALSSIGVNLNVIQLPDTTRTALDAASTLNCDITQIVKSLIFRTENTQKPILVLASGQNQVNLETISDVVGENVIKANAKFTKQVTGFAIGGVAPFAHKEEIQHKFIDEDLLNSPLLWAAAGNPHAVFSLSSDNLQQLCVGAQVVNFNERQRLTPS